MQKANQNQMVQSTNVNLVQLRQAEISYFATFFSVFGTQAALVSSFVVTSITQGNLY